jgi:Asp-tRNA(Asn)/Glu-tRNA(Gln) amidotransferase A subunit family amidase
MARELELFRRTFIAAVASTLAACKPGETPAHPRARTSGRPKPAASPATAELDTATVAAAERVLGVEYTDAERTLLLGNLQQQVAIAQQRRARPHPNALAPATVFDPRLPGSKLRVAKDRLRPPVVAAGKTPGDEEAIAFASLPQLGAWLRAGTLTSVRLTELYLQRLEAIGPALQCTVTLTRDRALQQARRADAELAAGRVRGPLHGIPWGAKDIIDTARIRTTWGAEPFVDRVPEHDAAVVRALDDAGAVLVAKLSTGALAYGDIWFGGRTRNPWNPREGSSGSSAGPAAAVAAGLCAFALGTETLGSIVSPCMRCGTTGLRPTFGRVPRTGTMALCWSLDKVGPITRFVDDAALVLAAIHGRDDGDPASRRLPYAFDARRSAKGLRVGFVEAWFADEASTAVDRQALDALKAIGVELVPIEIPALPYTPLLTILLAEAATAFEALTLDGRDDQLGWQSADAWPNTFRAARFLSAVDLVAADRLRREAMIAFDRTFANIDAVFGPSFAGSMLLATNCTGHPSLTLRAGFVERAPEPDVDGRKAEDQSAASCPHGITLWGHLYDEGTLCTIGRALQAELAVAARHPSM